MLAALKVARRGRRATRRSPNSAGTGSFVDSRISDSRRLREHLEEFGTGPHGRLFTGPRGGIITDRAYLKVFHEARTQALTAQEASSPLLDVPYALRHAAVSTWLSAGVAPPQVAEWAGHSVAVLLRVYAKCISGQQDEAMRRISDATRPEGTRTVTDQRSRDSEADDQDKENDDP